MQQSDLPEDKLQKELDKYKQFKIQKRPDNEYFSLMVNVVFYSGFKAETVTKKLPDIHKAFPNFETVAKFNQKKIESLLKDKSIIQNRTRILSVIHNAHAMRAIIEEFDSFHTYLASFGKPDNDENIKLLVKNLSKRFKYIGKITAYHFLTDLGFNVVKPDRVLCRIFDRLSLIENEKDYDGVINIARKISDATGHPVRYIDIVFVQYGQVGVKEKMGIPYGICIEKNPKCELCGVDKYCNYTGN
jgi:DNA-3-methyladenine glycosylase I